MLISIKKSKHFKRPHSLTNFAWKKGSFVTDNAYITHTESLLSADMLLLDTPLDYVAFFFSNDLLQKIKYQSELYSVQKNVNKPVTEQSDFLVSQIAPYLIKKMKKKMKRGESMEYVTYEKTPISAVIWKDNKAVKLVSTYCGETPKTKVTRFDRSKKKEIEIDCPKLVTEYNHNMGGVDLLDSHIVVNSWCLYKRAKKQKNEENEIMRVCRIEENTSAFVNKIWRSKT
ncbi:hypothetical protein QTP88_001846 [Uroleucon formosanum]